MEMRRATRQAVLGAAIRLALVFSAGAVVAALALDVVGELSTSRFLVAVAVTGFATSWVQTGRVARETEFRLRHRVAAVPVRQPIG